MIYDGRKGYRSGNLDQPVNTVLSMIKGPRLNKNWYSGVNPAYNIVISAGATGQIKLQGTNDVAFRGGVAETDYLPTDGASWSDLQGATSTTATGTFATSYEFLRLIITTQGAGYITLAWVRWT